MGEILHQFGIDQTLLVAQVINFAIILLLLQKLLYKPILTMLKNREEEIKKGLEDAKKAEELLAKTAEKEKKVLQDAQAQAKKIIDEAKGQSADILEETRKHAKRETEQMLKEAKEQISFEARQAEKRLAGNISQLAIRLLEKSLPSVLSENEQTALLKEVAKKVKGKIN